MLRHMVPAAGGLQEDHLLLYKSASVCFVLFVRARPCAFGGTPAQGRQTPTLVTVGVAWGSWLCDVQIQHGCKWGMCR